MWKIVRRLLTFGSTKRLGMTMFPSRLPRRPSKMLRYSEDSFFLKAICGFPRAILILIFACEKNSASLLGDFFT